MNFHCQNSCKSGGKWVFIPAQEVSHRHANQRQQVLRFDLQKKGHRLLIVVFMDVLPRGLSRSLSTLQIPGYQIFVKGSPE